MKTAKKFCIVEAIGFFVSFWFKFSQTFFFKFLFYFKTLRFEYEKKHRVVVQDGHEEGSGGNSPSSSDVSNFDGTMDSIGFGIDESTNGEDNKNFSCRFCPKVFDERSQVTDLGLATMSALIVYKYS